MNKKQEKAGQIMIDSGFFRDCYSRVWDVMGGNINSTNPTHETKTIIWGCKVLEQRIQMLKRKYPKYSKEFDWFYEPYYENLRQRHDFVLNRIFDNIREQYGDKQEEADNSN